MRKRITQDGLFRRIAAPDEFSGRNPNVPINLYDTHPNARFSVGSDVTFLDDKWMKVRGTVLGHAAEDRLWVQWPNSVSQEDAEELVAFRELGEGRQERPVSASRGSRTATTLTFDEVDRFNDEDEEDDDLEYIPDVPGCYN